MKYKLSLLFIAILIISLSAFCKSNKDKPTNIILMIGDGMGISQISAAMITMESSTAFERFPYSGFVKTQSKSNKITDSAAAGTAIATGNKTNNGMIGMNSDSIPVPSLLEILYDKGMKTGIVVSCYVTHATPASFIAKNINRSNYYEIAYDFAKTDKLNLLMGGGRKYFDNRKDSYNLIDTMNAKGWCYYESLEDVDSNEDKILVLADNKHLPAYPERGDFLPRATEIALQNLNKNNEKGFFLMIEGSQIDFAGHDNDSIYLVNELKDFNNTINIALDFAKNNPNTLVLVTADHETGGLTIMDPNEKYTDTYFHFSTGSHTPALVPIFSYGPGADKFSGIMDNTEIMRRILDLI